MDKYIIYCTEEQIKKALELGAPIKTYKPIIIDSKAGGSFTTPTMETITAEQLIGWLEERPEIDCIIIQKPMPNNWEWYVEIYTDSGFEDTFKKGECYTRMSATLAAIDTALEYLSFNNNKL